MNVKIKKTYRGPLGRFRRGASYELNSHVAAQLPAGVVDKAVAASPADKQARPDKDRERFKTK